MNEVNALRTDVNELFGVMKTMANVVHDLSVYIHTIKDKNMHVDDDEDYDTEDKAMPMDIEGEEDPMAEDPMGGGAPLPEEDELGLEDDVAMMGGNYKAEKGFANTSKKKKDEEDSSFGEQQNNVKGNEAQPADDQGGGSDDETFNKSASMGSTQDILKSVQSMVRKELDAAGLVRSQPMTPARGKIDKGRSVDEGVDMNELVNDWIKMDYKSINRARMAYGDLHPMGLK